MPRRRFLFILWLCGVCAPFVGQAVSLQSPADTLVLRNGDTLVGTMGIPFWSPKAGCLISIDTLGNGQFAEFPGSSVKWFCRKGNYQYILKVTQRKNEPVEPDFHFFNTELKGRLWYIYEYDSGGEEVHVVIFEDGRVVEVNKKNFYDIILPYLRSSDAFNKATNGESLNFRQYDVSTDMKHWVELFNSLP